MRPAPVLAVMFDVTVGCLMLSFNDFFLLSSAWLGVLLLLLSIDATRERADDIEKYYMEILYGYGNTISFQDSRYEVSFSSLRFVVEVLNKFLLIQMTVYFPTSLTNSMSVCLSVRLCVCV